MNKTILTILVFCFAVFSVSAQVENKKTTTASQKTAVKANQTNPQVDNPNAPIITFDKLVHDYGIMSKEDNGNAEFKFTNTGREPLILSNVRAS